MTDSQVVGLIQDLLVTLLYELVLNFVSSLQRPGKLVFENIFDFYEL